MTEYFPFDPNPRTPNNRAPEGTCDGQFHIFGDPAKFPVSPRAAYNMPTATIQAALKMHGILGVTRGVIVQSTAYGTNHGAVLEGLRVAGPSYKVCGIVNDTVTDSHLADLNAAGVNGARFNFLKSLNMEPSKETFLRSARRAAALGWYLKMQPPQEGILEYVDWFDGLEAQVLIDHLARIDFVDDCPNLKKLLELLARGNYWVMLSNAYRRSTMGPPWDDAIPYVRKIVEKAPDRAIWATDWPHPVSTKPVPNDADFLELFYRCIPEPDLQRKILVDNPVRLFGFAK